MGCDFEHGIDYDTPREAAWAAITEMATETGKSLAKRRLLVGRFPPGDEFPDMVWVQLPFDERWQERWPDPNVHGLDGLMEGLPVLPEVKS